MVVVKHREEGAWIPDVCVAPTAWTAHLWSIPLREQNYAWLANLGSLLPAANPNPDGFQHHSVSGAGAIRMDKTKTVPAPGSSQSRERQRQDQ